MCYIYIYIQRNKLTFILSLGLPHEVPFDCIDSGQTRMLVLWSGTVVPV